MQITVRKTTVQTTPLCAKPFKYQSFQYWMNLKCLWREKYSKTLLKFDLRIWIERILYMAVNSWIYFYQILIPNFWFLWWEMGDSTLLILSSADPSSVIVFVILKQTIAHTHSNFDWKKKFMPYTRCPTKSVVYRFFEL